mmetsp:Transcript_32416/g.97621  ORF Transcript_32416/g.97621 Transcript_32416/m.97621 type:complete len:165 (+) Transcript_32416:1416-1910(+)
MGGCPEKLKALIVAGAEVNKLNQDGQSPLMSATFSPDGCVDTLLSANAKVNLISNNGRSALHFACLSGMLKHVQTLIKAGARITLTRTLDSPLHLAAEWGHVDVVGFLVSLGCDPSFKNQVSSKSWPTSSDTLFNKIYVDRAGWEGRPPCRAQGKTNGAASGNR